MKQLHWPALLALAVSAAVCMPVAAMHGDHGGKPDWQVREEQRQRHQEQWERDQEWQRQQQEILRQRAEAQRHRDESWQRQQEAILERRADQQRRRDMAWQRQQEEIQLRRAHRQGQVHYPPSYGYGPRHYWERGQHYEGSAYRIHDHGRYRLRPPPQGYEWVRTGGYYLLLTVGSGEIIEVRVR